VQVWFAVTKGSHFSKMEEIEEFSGFSQLSIAKCEQRSQILSEIIRNLENEIPATENGGYTLLIFLTQHFTLMPIFCWNFAKLQLHKISAVSNFVWAGTECMQC
jgi:hypothetical protein